MAKICKKLKEEYLSVWDNFSDYRLYFGGIGEIWCSPYLHFAFILAIIIVCVPQNPAAWQGPALDILPDMLGFSLGGYAVLISFGDEKFRQYLAKKTPVGSHNSLFLLLNGAFLHFILAQLLAILYTVCISSLGINNKTTNIIGCTLFVYATSFCIAVAFELKTVGKWYQQFVKNNK